ncbi:MAG: RnfABCDGE type electron transport complex subunit D [Kiritimatiellia bacterium]|jgi:electron transport complex protein RnfD|nr:RnfABCDGE type electron transport complex subunit D [Kiritimatiellia bacterium]
MKPEAPADLLIISPSPHTHAGSSVERIMLDVLIALLPALAASLWFFRWHALRLTVTCVAACLLTEWLCRKAMRRASTLSDFSAAVTGLLLAFNLPPALPTWMAVAGSVFAIAVAKQVFGGLGYNPFNPALAARAFLLISFTGPMTTWSGAPWIRRVAYAAGQAATGASAMAADALTSATPLGFAKEALKSGQPMPLFGNPELLRDFFLGNLNGCIGETSALALLLGAAYLLFRKVISWHIPAAYLGSVLLYAAILHGVSPSSSIPPHIHLLSGGLLLGAFFMATDMVTSPLTRRGMLIFGAGCGILTMLIRTVKTGAYPEGVSFAILIMNAFTPLINRATRNRVFGTQPHSKP